MTNTPERNILKTLYLDNFRSFQKTKIDFSKITLLTGANSSGKSSIINSILSIVQSEQFPYFLSLNGKYVELGGFEEIARNGKTNNDIEISGEYFTEIWYDRNKYKTSFKTIWEVNTVNDSPKIKELSLENDFLNIKISSKYYENEDGQKRQTYCLSIQAFALGFILKELKKRFQNIPQIKNSKKQKYTKNVISFEDAKFDSLEEMFSDFMDNETNYFMKHINHTIFSTIGYIENKFNFIGSFRYPPQRTYYQKSGSKRKVNFSGEGYVDQLVEWEEKNDIKMTKLKDTLIDLELATDIKSHKLKGGRFELKLKTSEKSFQSSLSDVGFGLSQFLPIIVADLQLGSNSLLAVSQPEIHLHPKVQANFANYLTKQINENNKQYIIESHSEYLINRIRLLIAEGELSTNDVKVYYLEKVANTSILHEVNFEKDGRITGAPDSFFDTYMMDVMNIAIAATE
ncbi:DUF3696 domain-containing protein [Hymenobacter fodinae]|uniref:DUF3696 domain-containing protein n=1 Tax=Hymenobacter fodinae TaxID=2510796 RepID=A0A4Z0PDK5_9BACT|nr:DUF3696 domain-containing protein [Hymenobacter fodinae]TGE10343.1 DUF3696 domain-containing protein [Hymenobacter fodinae]